jgi:hypothetical protein
MAAPWAVEIGDETPCRYSKRAPSREQEGIDGRAAGGELRMAFAFDTKRKADDRFDAHLARLKKKRK